MYVCVRVYVYVYVYVFVCVRVRACVCVYKRKNSACALACYVCWPCPTTIRRPMGHGHGVWNPELPITNEPIPTPYPISNTRKGGGEYPSPTPTHRPFTSALEIPSEQPPSK